MDELDRRILAFTGAHPFVLDWQTERFLEVDQTLVSGRVAMLEAQGMVRSERLHAGSDIVRRITAGGLRAITSRLEAPGFELTGLRREVAAVGLWVAAWQGAFGEPERVLSRREMQALDRAGREAGGDGRRFAVSAAGRKADGGLVYPDVMLIYTSMRVAMHMLLWPHRGIDLDELFAAHRKQPEVADLVAMFLDEPGVKEGVWAAADRQGIRERVRVRAIAWRDPTLPEASAE